MSNTNNTSNEKISRRRFNKKFFKVLGLVALVPLLLFLLMLALNPKKFNIFHRSSPKIKTKLLSSGFNVAQLDDGGTLVAKTNSKKYFILNLAKDIDIEMVDIPGRTFKMGSPENEADRQKDEAQISMPIKTFYMSRYPITQAQWKEVARFPKVNLKLEEKPSTFDEDENLPVETISWEEAKEFCDRLTRKFKDTHRYSLPTEAQWEYACRANTTTPFYFGETITPEVANYDCHYLYGRTLDEKDKKNEIERYKGKTISVKALQLANDFGLEGMCGNVWQWCDDVYFDSYENALNNKNDSASKEPQNRVIRGGAWNSFPSHCRSAKRKYQLQNVKMNTIGFRVVCVLS